MREAGHVSDQGKSNAFKDMGGAEKTWGNNQQDYFYCIQFPLAITCQAFVNYSSNTGISLNQKVSTATVCIAHVIQIKADLCTNFIISCL